MSPGLGESEAIYSTAAAMYNVGQIVACVLVAITTKWLGTRIPLIIASLCNAVGYLLYGLAQNSAAVIAARVFIGSTAVMVPTSVAYFGASAQDYQALCEAEGRKCAKHLSKKLIGAYSAVAIISYIATYGAK